MDRSFSFCFHPRSSHTLTEDHNALPLLIDSRSQPPSIIFFDLILALQGIDPLLPSSLFKITQTTSLSLSELHVIAYGGWLVVFVGYRIISWVDGQEAAKGRRSSIGRDKQQWNNEKVKGERRGFVAPLLTGNAQENTSDGGASAENRDRRRKETGRVP
ncbi:unnamed protein product [Lactuca saligna]|uniref:Uncharacterized protein n=1 Tax=Lactuca saligna TaxID=75948 RepID=A0AA35YTF9_LACSI|nr:unnamed protein product [Lactuca saligna]